jgi:hypothetical protein
MLKLYKKLRKKKDPTPHELVKFVTHVNRTTASQIKKKACMPIPHQIKGWMMKWGKTKQKLWLKEWGRKLK